MTVRHFLYSMLVLGAACGGQADTVLPGIDVLARDNFRQLAGARVALITNHTGLSRNGTSTIRLLDDAPNVDLVRIFSPEHGIEGKLDTPVIGDGADAETGLPVYSLYGEMRRPTPAMLDGVDTIVFDIQDIGTRFYTYISTMGNAMLAAADNNVRFVVLDRPNPINGLAVEGPVLDDGLQSFVGFHTIPVRHGMTVGELALLFRSELGLDLDLQVVPADGWRREQFLDDSGLPWIDTSPNMRSLRAALLYPGIGLLETTNLSVGRGTDAPFERLGAPWIDGEAFASSLNALGLDGVSFTPARFTPGASKFADERCEGVRIVITDREKLEPLTVGFAIARQLLLDYGESWQTDAYIRLLGNEATLAALLGGESVDEIEAVYRPGLEAFVARRARFLLYD